MMAKKTPQEKYEEKLGLMAEGTQKKYSEKFKLFCERWNTNSQELYETRKSDLKSDEPLDMRRIEDMVEQQMAEMITKQGKSKNTAKQLKKAVCFFFTSVNLPLSVNAKTLTRGEANGQKMMRPAQIIELIENQNRLNKRRNKAIILVAKDSGLRVSDIQLLTIEAYEEAEVVTNEVGEPFKVFNPENTKKCDITAHIHLGVEAIEAVDAYLEERRKKGLIEGKPMLFINRKKQPFTGDSMGNMVAHQCTLLGAKFKKLSMHSLRKFHRTMLQKSKVSDSWIDKLQGKKSDTYSRPSEGPAPESTGELVQAFIGGYENLRVYGVPEELKAKEREIEALRKENAEATKMIPDLMKAIAELRAEVEQLKSKA